MENKGDIENQSEESIGDTKLWVQGECAAPGAVWSFLPQLCTLLPDFPSRYLMYQVQGVGGTGK